MLPNKKSQITEEFKKGANGLQVIYFMDNVLILFYHTSSV